MSSAFDFIVIGAGASGCVVASRLATSSSKPSVLLLEAGGLNDSPVHLAAAERFNIAFNPALKLNWGYKTEPQLGRHQIDYSRGRGLGGSTAINFCAWLNGPRGDWDEWARLTGDDSFSWKNARRHLDKIENLHTQIPDPRLDRFISAQADDHSSNGLVDLTYGGNWLPDLEKMYIAAEQTGFKMNRDISSGDPIGFGMAPVCIKDGLRVTSASAYLKESTSNLTIVADTHVARLIFEGTTAVGAETVDGRRFTATKEVILSAGALNSPQILMLSGVGPREELQKHGIAVVKDLPNVGRNLQDHPYSSIGVILERREDTPANGHPQAPTPMAFLKSDEALSSAEFDALPEDTRRFMASPTVPTFETIAFTPPRNLSYTPSPESYFIGANCILMLEQSRGSVTLRSSDPTDAPVIDPAFLTHPYDRRALTDAVRQTMRLLRSPVYADRVVRMLGPADESDAAIWKHIEGNLHSLWHMSCAVGMGASEENGCVDTEFRVFGVKRLRIVDLSVCIFVPNTHTQSTAYVIGEMAAEKILAEHDLA